MTPPSTASRAPASTAEAYSRGTEPPTIFHSNWMPEPGGSGSTASSTSPYMPRPRVARLGGLGDRLAVGHLGSADVGVDAVLAHQPVDDHLQVQLAHAGDDRLAGLGVGVDPEGGVLIGQLAQADAHLVLVLLGLGLDGHPDDRLGEDDRLQHDRVLL